MGRVCVVRDGHVVDLPLGRNDERVLLPYDMAFVNRLLGNEPFPLPFIEVLDLYGCRPFSDVETLDER